MSTMKRAFKAASVFAGSAALTAGAVALAPTAHAKTISGNIIAFDCSQLAPTLDVADLHLYYKSDHVPGCVGGARGHLSFSNATTRAHLDGYCGGEAVGSLVINGTARPIGHDGNIHHFDGTLTSVYIFSYDSALGFTCPNS